LSGCVQGSFDAPENRWEIPQHFFVAEAEYPDVQASQCFGASSIVVLLSVVDGTVEFDAQFLPRAREIEDEPFDRVLAAERNATHLLPA